MNQVLAPNLLMRKPLCSVGNQLKIRTIPGRSAEEIVVGRCKMEAVGLHSRRELDPLGRSLARLWPVDHSPCFDDLLLAIDNADQRTAQLDGDQQNPATNRIKLV